MCNVFMGISQRIKELSFLVASVVAFAIAVSGCGKAQPPQQPAISVMVGRAETRDMPVQIESVGSVVSFNSVTVTPQVTGRVLRLHFKEGQDVKAGDLLVTIDPAPFEQKLAQAQALLAHDTEQAAFSMATAKRYESLFKQGAVSRQDYEQATTAAMTQSATVNQSAAAVESSRIDLTNCYVRSPIDGRTGAFLANLGTLATANVTQLLVVNQVEPIFARFTVQERDLVPILEAQKKRDLKVSVNVKESGLTVNDGILTFIDNTVDVSSGVIQLKAQFPNQKRELWPGQFIRATLVLGVQPNAVVVPAEAVNQGQAGRYVYIVKEDMTVESIPVEQNRVIDKYAVVSKGLNPGDTVVTDGQVNLRVGAKVVIKTAGDQPGNAGAKPQGGGTK